MMTEDELSRTQHALVETTMILQNERSYQTPLRQQHLIDYYESHRSKLIGYLEADVLPDVFVRPADPRHVVVARWGAQRSEWM